MIKVVLISGKAGVGKNELAVRLSSHLINKGIIVANCAFADEVKEVAIKSFGWDGKKDEKGRKLLQVIGTDAGRGYDIDIWANKLVDSMLYASKIVDVFIVTDWRFPNESQVVEDNFPGSVLKIRVESPERETLKGTPEYNHPSETSLLSAEESPRGYYDVFVYNKGTLEDLDESSKKLVSELF